MKRRPTIKDVAEAAGVGTATVDRVLHGRNLVRPETAQKISDAAFKVGYHAANLISQKLQSDLPTVTFGVLLRKKDHAFYQHFAQEIEQALHANCHVRARVEIDYTDSQTALEFAQRLSAMEGRVDVVAAVAIENQKVTDAVARLRSAGIPTFALLSDFSQKERCSYVGTNNTKFGRTAAWLLSKLVNEDDKIALFTGGHRWRGHELRETGFREFIRDNGPRLQILDTIINLETNSLTYEETIDLLSRHPDLSGIYIAGGGMEGAIEALRELRQPGEVSLVVNELTSISRQALYDGYVNMVLSTPLPELCRELAKLMTSSVLDGADVAQNHVVMNPVVTLPESI
ncbi:MAG: LacI family DNA-binding transcriptional regulator [Pseudomonadota bacterium]